MFVSVCLGLKLNLLVNVLLLIIIGYLKNVIRYEGKFFSLRVFKIIDGRMGGIDGIGRFL